MHSIYEEQPTDMKQEKYFRNFARNWEKHKHQPFSQKNLKTKKKKYRVAQRQKLSSMRMSSMQHMSQNHRKGATTRCCQKSPLQKLLWQQCF